MPLDATTAEHLADACAKLADSLEARGSRTTQEKRVGFLWDIIKAVLIPCCVGLGSVYTGWVLTKQDLYNQLEVQSKSTIELANAVKSVTSTVQMLQINDAVKASTIQSIDNRVNRLEQR